MSSTRRISSGKDVLKTPRYVSTIRVFQLVLAIVLLGLSAYGVSKYAYDGFGLTLFTALATIIITIYILFCTECYSSIYNYWAILGLDIFLLIFWLIAFSVVATNSHSYYYGYSCYGNICDFGAFDLDYNTTYQNALRVAAVLGAIEFLVFTVTLIFTGVFIHRHQKDVRDSMPHPGPENIEMREGSNAAGP